MTLVMLVGLVSMKYPNKIQGARAYVVTALVVLGGLWNSLWYGLQNLNQFWGLAGLVSGVIMLLAAFLILLQNNAREVPGIAVTLVKIGLLLSFLLYAVTLVQLNLGLDIID